MGYVQHAKQTGEDQVVEEVRSVIREMVDWEWAQTLYQTQNLGCKLAVSGALSGFRKEEMGIILEDDCLPDLSFSAIAKSCLRFNDDESIFMISVIIFKEAKSYILLLLLFMAYPHLGLGKLAKKLAESWFGDEKLGGSSVKVG